MTQDTFKRPGNHGVSEAISGAAYEASKLHDEPLVEQHFEGLSQHYAGDESIQGVVDWAEGCVRRNPWLAVGTTLLAGVVFGMLLTPVTVRPVRRMRQRMSRQEPEQQDLMPS